MSTVRNPAVLGRLVERLEALRPDTPRRWGTMTSGEMLCHLGDATASVLGRPADAAAKAHPILKWVALRSGLPWPRGLPTPARVDPKAGGTTPTDFETDRRRAIDGLKAFAGAPASALTSNHGAFGRMTPEDWHRWAFRHTDHHLRQFGL